jgi:ABC-type lipoprotein export system ATPase subunit
MMMIQLEGVHKRFASGGGWIHILKGADLSVRNGEVVALIGPSGVGKSTLLHLIGGLDHPDAGLIRVDDKVVTDLQGIDLDQFRRRSVAIVYQFHFLLPEFSALENVMLPAIVAGDGRDAEKRSMKLLREVGLEARANHAPSKLSGGEQQRVAIARALINEPRVLLADEPTGNLDEETAGLVFDLLMDLKNQHSLTILMATHNSGLAGACDRILRLKDGRIG